jgi:hypothetical protein
MKRDCVVNEVIARLGSPGSLVSKSSLRPTSNLNDARHGRIVRSAQMKKMLSTNWQSRLASIRKKRTGRSGKAEAESQTMKILQRLLS